MLSKFLSRLPVSTISIIVFFFIFCFFQAEDGIRDLIVTGVQTCALPIYTYGGEVVTNPSGGLISKGHPLGATGLAQCFELVTQLRGQAGKRQVAEAKIGLAHNVGIGGACVVTMLGAT